MKSTIISLITSIIIIISTPNLLAQAKTIEERLADLEKRVAALEAKSSSDQTIRKPQTPKTTEKITDEIIISTIKEKLKKEVPPTWAGSLMGGRNAVIEKIDVQQIGNYNEQGKYWPVKCRVKGICDADLLFETKKVAFDKVGDFKIHQDDYGKWYAEIETF
ncbi:MAG: hypothetical protein K8I03_09870 [Ignavibacteria bacterium]|nr:hypothetical protein [Ignavibacteria bacterium]